MICLFPKLSSQVPLKYKGEVEVEGIKIQYDGLYITVILPNGIMVTWDGIISTQVGLLLVNPDRMD